MGLPVKWARVKKWLEYRGHVYVSARKNPSSVLKNKELVQLNNYYVSPPASFWNSFPKCELPLSAKSQIVVRDLENMLLAKKDRLTTSSFLRGKKTVENLKNGANSFQSSKLPPCFVQNPKSAYQFGPATTDTIPTWVKMGFACGPFDTPPSQNLESTV